MKQGAPRRAPKHEATAPGCPHHIHLVLGQRCGLTGPNDGTLWHHAQFSYGVDMPMPAHGASKAAFCATPPASAG